MATLRPSHCTSGTVDDALVTEGVERQGGELRAAVGWVSPGGTRAGERLRSVGAGTGAAASR